MNFLVSILLFLFSEIAVSSPLRTSPLPQGAKPVGAPGAVQDLKITTAASPVGPKNAAKALSERPPIPSEDEDAHTVRNTLAALSALTVAGSIVAARAVANDKKKP